MPVSLYSLVQYESALIGLLLPLPGNYFFKMPVMHFIQNSGIPHHVWWKELVKKRADFLSVQWRMSIFATVVESTAVAKHA